MHVSQRSFPKHSAESALIVLALTLTACGDDEPALAAGGAAGSGGSGGTTGTGAPATCDITLSPGETDTEAVQTALIEADSGQTICLQPGTYVFESELLLQGTPGITVRGIGESRDEVVLDFAAQDGGDEAIDVQADGFTLEHLTLKDPPGDGVKVSNSDRPTFRDVKAFWAAGSVAGNGAYALYPALCTNVLIEHCEVVGAADAGIYLGQSTRGIVRHNKAHGNVIGIEAENSLDVAIYDNEAWDNTCGILVVNLPGLTKKEMIRASVHDNLVYDNNHENFGEDAAFVSAVPRGTGILISSADETHVYGNTLRGNGGAAVLVLSWPTIAFIGGIEANDPLFEQYSETTYIHDNQFEGNGATPPQDFAGPPLNLVAPIESILWDGFLDPTEDPSTAEQRRLCIVNNPGANFRNFNVPDLANPTTDLMAHYCAYSPLPRVVFE